jgi:hypothetical protein
MSNDNDPGKIFKFSLYQGEILLCEKIIDPLDFSPEARYPINIRNILPKSINLLQKVLSKRYYETFAYVGSESYYDLFGYNNSILDSFSPDIKQDLIYNPDYATFSYFDTVANEERVVKGVPCRIGFYANDKPIVERVFYVNGFNPIARYSTDIVDAVSSITDEIYKHLKNLDMEYMIREYESQYRELVI